MSFFVSYAVIATVTAVICLSVMLQARPNTRTDHVANAIEGLLALFWGAAWPAVLLTAALVGIGIAFSWAVSLLIRLHSRED